MTATLTPQLGELLTSTGAPLPLAGVDVTADVTGPFASLNVTQRFVNDTGADAEVTYTFPLPGRLAVTHVELHTNGSVIVAELKERGAARERYEQALADGVTAALVEEDRPEVFTVSLGNVPAGADAAVVLSLTGPCTVVDGRSELRVPTAVGARYAEGTPTDRPGVAGHGVDTDAAPDASRTIPNHRVNGIPFTFTVSSDLEPVAADGLDVTESGDGWRTSTPDGFCTGAPVVVSWPAVIPDQPAAVAVTAADAGVDATDNVVAVTINPPRRHSEVPRDLVVLLDQSGSMARNSFELAARATSRIIDSAAATDRVAVIAFNGTTRTSPGGLVAATDENRFEITKFVATLAATGSTEMSAAINAAADLLATPSAEPRQQVLVMVTDALIAAEDRAVRATGRLVSAGVTIHGVAIGAQANGGLLPRLCRDTGGFAHQVATASELDRSLDGIRARAAAPSLRNVTITTPDGEPFTEQTPATASGNPGVLLTVAARCASIPSEVVVSGELAGGGTVTWTVPVTASSNTAVWSAWARQHVRELEDRRLVDPEAVPASTIVAAALESRVLCRFVAFVAVDDAPVASVATPRGSQRRSKGIGSPLRGMNLSARSSRSSMSASASSSHTVALNSIASSSGSFRDATIAPYIGDPYPAHPPFTYPQPTPWQVPTAWPTTIVYPATSTASTGAITDGRTALRLVAAGSPPADAATAVARLRTELLLAENHDETLVALLARLAAELLTGNNGSAQEIAKQALELLDDAGETVEDSDGVDDTEPFWDQP